MEYLVMIMINSLYIVGLYQSFQDGMIFEKINPYPAFKLWKPEKKVLNYLFKPIIGCVTCMASVHGLLFLFVFRNYLHLDICIVFFYIFALAGMNRILTVVADL